MTHIHRERLKTPMATSVFFGGGTPSLIPAESLARILGAITVADGAEITVECNPDTVTSELAQTYVEAGVNRISLGVQSMVPSVLAKLGRGHPVTATQLGLSLDCVSEYRRAHCQ